LKSRGRDSNPRTPDHKSDALSITPSIHMYKSTHLWYIYSKHLAEILLARFLWRDPYFHEPHRRCYDDLPNMGSWDATRPEMIDQNHIY
jgi:hypothetical protein